MKFHSYKTRYLLNFVNECDMCIATFVSVSYVYNPGPPSPCFELQ